MVEKVAALYATTIQELMTEDATDKLQGIEIIGQTTPLDEPTGFPNDLHVLHNLLEAKNKIITGFQDRVFGGTASRSKTGISCGNTNIIHTNFPF